MHSLLNLRSVGVQSWAVVCAESVVFIHACALDKSDIAKVVLEQSLFVPPIAKRNPKTIETEDSLEISSSIYFYAGRSYPAAVGTIAYAIALSDWDGVRLNALVSPFDTGGLHHDKLKLNWRDYSNNKRTYLNEHTSSLTDFADYFARFLTAFFCGVPDYWQMPTRPIDGASLTSGDDWRNWTFELREAGKTSVKSATWYFDHESYSHYLDLVSDGVIEPLSRDRYKIVSAPIEEAEDDARTRMFATVK